MSVKPIRFNGPMVRAIADNLKTETRRPVDPQPDHSHWFGDHREAAIYQGGDKEDLVIQSPYSVGDVLWVRETYVIEHGWDAVHYPPPFTDGRPVKYLAMGQWYEQCHYRATDPTPALDYHDGTEGPCCRWKPSIHMPREWARLFLLVTAVRCEPLQKITEEGAIAEGFAVWERNDDCPMQYSALTVFRDDWNSIYAKRGLGFAEDPWVWVTKFERTEAP